jgi:hypothetical protein
VWLIASHHTTTDIIDEVMKIVAFTIAAYRLGSLQDLCKVSENALTKDWCSICQALSTISSKVIFLVRSWWLKPIMLAAQKQRLGE